MTTTTDVRDRISAYLAERGGWADPISGTDGGNAMWMLNGRSDINVFVINDIVTVNCWPTDRTSLPADAPDLLARLGETLDELGA